ncbi:uncharacterized protein [Dermacentor andersoni]|uniref:uncharacterized protein n=1 Tax=Dermacentor andersoni TaxID=34620 RepID=UPI002416A960|nr:uncharacterized protein LOC129382256 [Dermacentor andersoni]
MKAGVLPGDVTPPTVVGGGAPPQQALVFSPADVPLPKFGVPRSILTCRPNSHPFPERVLNLDQPAKVGRSVARCRQAPNNAIFDCKVLSRNHSLLWYENGKFYLQDTKSSNGTFVSNQRPSKGAERSPAQEVCSGDIVQFGVDVVENSRRDMFQRRLGGPHSGRAGYRGVPLPKQPVAVLPYARQHHQDDATCPQGKPERVRSGLLRGLRGLSGHVQEERDVPATYGCATHTRSSQDALTAIRYPTRPHHSSLAILEIILH